jgi:hypothetical protein
VTPLEPGDGADRAYRQMLERLCVRAEVPVVDHASVVNDEAMMRGFQISFRIEKWSGFVKVYVDAGQPDPSREHELYRYLLEQQLVLPAPFSMLAAVDPGSGHIIFYGCAPLSTDDVADTEFFGFLNGCVYAAELVKPNLSWAG